MSGGSKILNTDTGLINYQHDRCMLCGKKMLTETGFRIIDMIGTCQVKVKCFNGYRLNELSAWQVHVGWNQNVQNRDRFNELLT